MLTLVAAVLVYDLARETCEARSFCPLASLSRYVMFDTREENDIVQAVGGSSDGGGWRA
jgi:hypothetical protein